MAYHAELRMKHSNADDHIVSTEDVYALPLAA